MPSFTLVARAEESRIAAFVQQLGARVGNTGTPRIQSALPDRTRLFSVNIVPMNAAQLQELQHKDALGIPLRPSVIPIIARAVSLFLASRVPVLLDLMVLFPVQFRVNDVKIHQDAGEMILISRVEYEALIAENTALKMRVADMEREIATLRQELASMRTMMANHVCGADRKPVA